MPIAFANLVKKTVSETLGYKCVHTSGGKGPIVQFETFSTKKHSESLLFQKSQWDQSFYVEVSSTGIMPVKGGEFLYEGLVSVVGERFRGLAGKGDNIPYGSKEDLVKSLLVVCRKIPKPIAKYHERAMRTAKEFSAHADHFLEWYTRWHALKDRYDYSKTWVDRLKRKQAALLKSASDDEAETNELMAYIRFASYLVQEKLFPFELADKQLWLWHFWHFGRPVKKEEYGKFKDCIRCGDAKTKGRFVQKRDKVFGAYHDFICAKCG